MKETLLYFLPPSTRTGLEVEGNNIRITEERRSEMYDDILGRGKLTGIFFQKL